MHPDGISEKEKGVVCIVYRKSLQIIRTCRLALTGNRRNDTLKQKESVTYETEAFCVVPLGYDFPQR